MNGKPFDGTMPAAILNDEELADTLTYVLNSWENEAGEISAEEVKAVRATTQFPTFEDLVKANAFAPLPKPPEGFAIREVVRLTNHVSRLLPRHRASTRRA